MTYSYSAPLTYEQPAYPLTYDGSVNPPMKPKNPANTTGVIAAIGGTIGGAVIGSKKVPYFNKEGEVVDTFVKQAYEKYLKKAPADVKEEYSHLNNVLKNLKKIKSPDELRNLLNNNAKARTVEIDELLPKVAEENLASNKKTIQELVLAKKSACMQGMRNDIHEAWDGAKWSQPAGLLDDKFKAIKKAANNVKACTVAKYAVVGAAIAGVTGYLLHNIISSKKDA